MTNLEQQLSQKLEILLKQTALSITDQQKEQLIKLVLLLNKWNKAYNLTSVRDPMEMLVKHILDSVVVSPYLQGKHFIDVGTGPGLPGLPLAIVNPHKHFVLLDSLGKRISFIRNAIRELGLDNVEAVLSRVEEYHPEQPFDGVLSRAFASLKDMTDWCQHLPKQDGYFYALKGLYHQEEVEELSEKFTIQQVIRLHVPELIGERHLVIVK
ncbi:TPA: 16S rRNA (guanine(527)-N(7))-methyltransferase RsmG [Pasteurella multocida]|uniref:16S rRNA (guanine(527)-N(7))-methyltransferase RsmG n=1 Tax=Pasteurella multocida TaxID=747 RepID=UPI0028E00DE2|nr:16S rRNA (guanine(527)-N(7))-methyltransferase RsmG [Pasteurella multocida]MDT8766418.1 16S rRNA (guanine(527)-N(7))-methyltransferase RsmG [Pasteurella multocida]MEB3485461.1 16S rRNA (guanine(527)-N(7))-methyltransferase RsmG [Pasteurella multocida]MEB3495832.1 16S rRNA (guanine(527)-N(7))-methyltransferase RsmG [Pasteurella multocida]HDR0968462.1 16S rRNA (guanine(527)-N(7))-methyltransferase RsmG [Pasteurella multocida]HDR0970742.1 16S rRNA (guanine(527)-N(7))-methyltransferase RsmG [Pa